MTKKVFEVCTSFDDKVATFQGCTESISHSISKLGFDMIDAKDIYDYERIVELLELEIKALKAVKEKAVAIYEIAKNEK